MLRPIQVPVLDEGDVQSLAVFCDAPRPPGPPPPPPPSAPLPPPPPPPGLLENPAPSPAPVLSVQDELRKRQEGGFKLKIVHKPDETSNDSEAVAGPSSKHATLPSAIVRNTGHKENRAGMSNVHSQILAGVQLRSTKQRASNHAEVIPIIRVRADDIC